MYISCEKYSRSSIPQVAEGCWKLPLKMMLIVYKPVNSTLSCLLMQVFSSFFFSRQMQDWLDGSSFACKWCLENVEQQTIDFKCTEKSWTKNAPTVIGSKIRICSWSMSVFCMYTRVDRLAQKAAEILLHGWYVVTPICCFFKMPQVRTVHDNPGYV